MALDRDRFVSDCLDALAESSPQRAVREVVSRAVSDAPCLRSALGEPHRADVQRLLVSDDLTILNVVWTPRMVLMPHNHNMWAVIGVYVGREDNIFWRRRSNGPPGTIEAVGARSLGPGDAHPLGRDVIHSVTNPTSRFTGAIHVYGGDFFSTARSEWDPESLEERPYDLEKNLKLFEESNAIRAAERAQ